MSTVSRNDAGRLEVQIVAGGAARIKGRMTRTGVLTYQLADGSKRRELRHPEEVFHPDSLATLRSATVTVGHPPEPVSADNWKNFSVGHVGDDVKADAHFVAGPVVVSDAATLKRVMDKELVEISSGYECRLDSTPGVYGGEAYDAIQRDIKYNHIALGPRGWGRAGPEVSLRLDAGFEIVNGESKMRVTKIDGVDYEVGSDAHLAKLDSQYVAKLNETDSRRATEATRADSLQAQVETLKAELNAAKDPGVMTSAILNRTKTIAACQKLMGESFDSETMERFATMTTRDAMVTALKSKDNAFDPGDRSEDFIAGVFEARLSGMAKDSAGEARADAANQRPAPGSHEPVKSAYDRAVEVQKQTVYGAWKLPL